MRLEHLRYGNLAIDELIDGMIKKTGALPETFIAKIVGGASSNGDTALSVAKQNIDVAYAQLKERGIQVLGADVGSVTGRRVLFHTATGQLQVSSLDSREQKKRVLIIDDSRSIRNLLAKVLSEDPSLEVVGSAENPIAAAPMIKSLQPDVITLDIHMPQMDGITFLESLMRQHPIPVVMITSMNINDSDSVLRALELGAVDYVQKPSLSELPIAKHIIQEKVRSAALAKVNLRGNLIDSPAPIDLTFVNQLPIAIGASTGGTEAIRKLLLQLPENIPPILIVQHIPATFSKAFAARLNEICRFPVKEAEDGDPIKPGQVLIAPGGRQMRVRTSSKGFEVEVNDDAPMNRHKPSVDYLFLSVAQHFGKNAVGVILTGMGTDGAKGLLRMRQAGARTIGQDEQSCIVYGMPRVAFEIGGVNEVYTLEKIAPMLVRGR